MNDMNSLSHTSWNCKYHIVYAPMHRNIAGKCFTERTAGIRRNFTNAVHVEKGQDCRSRSQRRPCTYAVGKSAKSIRVQFHGILERKEQSDDIREIPGMEVQV